ncbi:MAG: hypothetical protein HRU70_07140 [Phycisphaeraceae bacterium]|nr:MAG: hypothetical protein HRU70_07140 [Phycisphaeraceae bacterium]
MHALVIVNPSSGRGLARTLAERVGQALEALGVTVSHASPDDLTQPGLSPRDADLAVVVGGDGTVHRLLPWLVRSRAALYHYPAGTENLFARDWGMRPDPDTLARAVRRWRVRRTDLGEIGHAPGPGPGSRFAVMCSVGLDASVIRRVHADRRGPISHAAYLRPILAELCDPYLPRLRVRVDGVESAVGRGLVVVANSRQYAARLNPARDADPTDGLLDPVFLHAESAADAARLALAARLGRLRHEPGTVLRRGVSIEVQIESTEPMIAQADGEALGAIPDTIRTITVTAMPRVLRVLEETE